jgi:formylglycine-generating enzyme required for sulfatase activity
MIGLLKSLIVIAAIFFLLAASAMAEKRIALVIGNDRYPNLSSDRQLAKAVNDAQAVGDALGKIGFSVIRGTNLGRQGMVDKLAELTAQLRPGDTAAFFYAGHGVAIGGVNYLVPSDVPAVTPDAEARVRGNSLAEGDVVAELEAKGVRVALLVLDACRDNPFPRTATRSIGSTRGLADAKPARGVFTIYSAGIGQTALDRLEPNDPSRDSVFTRIFVDELVKPGIDLAGLAIDVRERVAQLALQAKDNFGRPEPHDQTPAYYDQTVGGRIYLARLPARSGPAGGTTAPAPADPVAQAWVVTQYATSVVVLEDFIRQFGKTPYGSMARARLEQLRKSQVAGVAPPVAPAVPSVPCGGRAVTVSLSRASAPLSAAEECLLKPKDTFKECVTCPEMVVVPAGAFTMGSPANEQGRWVGEGPQHDVTIARQLEVGKFAVTFAEWDACVADGGCKGYRPSDQSWGRGQRPTINVSWNDAETYVAWLSRKTGRTYRLPSEAEREYVTRAGTATPFWWGPSISTQQANYDGFNYRYGSGAKGEYRRKTMPVRSFSPNPWGLYQVHGNVSEWVEDCWHDSYAGAPSDGSAWTTAGDCSSLARRFLGWQSGAPPLGGPLWGPSRLPQPHRRFSSCSNASYPLRDTFFFGREA